MAQTITVQIKADTEGFKRDVKQATDAAGANLRQFKSAVDSSAVSVAATRTALIGMGIAGVAAFKQIANQAIQAAVEVDKTRKTLTALTGSVEAANRKLAELRQLAASSPGVTTSFASQLFAQLKAIGEISDQTINRVITSIGRLNAVFNIESPATFSRNLTQIFQQGFERGDIKEAIGQVPIFEQILKRAFGTNNPDALRRLKESGNLTLDGFLKGISEAVATDPRFKNIQDSIASQFEKLKDRINVALTPIGDEIIKALMPIVRDLVAELERLGPKVAAAFRDNQSEIKAFAATLGDVAKSIETLGEKLGGFGGKVLSFRNAIRASLAGLTLSTGGLALPLQVLFERNLSREDAAAAAEAQRQAQRNRGLPFGLTLDNLISEVGTITPRATGGGGSGSNNAASAEAAKKAEELRKKIVEVRTKIAGLAMDLAVDDLSRLATDIAQQQIQDVQSESARLGRPAQIAGYSAALAERIRFQELEDLKLAQNTLGANASELQRAARRDLSRSDGFIGDLVNRGALTPEQADALNQAANRQYASQLREVLALREQMSNVSKETVDDLRDEIDLYDRLGAAISDTERFMRGFNSATISVGDAFERFGQNVARALTSTKDLLNGLKQAVLGFFNDLLGRSLQNLVGQALAPLAGIFDGGFGQAAAVGAGGGLFRTPPTFSQATSSTALRSFADVINGAGGGGGSGLAAPESISAAGLPIFRGNFPVSVPIANASGGVLAGAAGSAGRFSFGAVGRSIASAAPFLGFSLGSGLGGQSIPGQILGSAGGALGGLVLGASTGAIKGSLGAAFKLSGALGPIGLVAGAGLLVGSYFLGKAKQRRQDEELSGQYLTQALTAIDQLAAGVGSGQISGSEANGVFENQILAQFTQQIRTLKTKSVVESRLTNQVRDLRNVFEARIPPLIVEQERKAADARRFAAIDSRLIPQFAGGGYVGGIDRGFDSVSALLRPGELVLNRGQQAAVIAQSSPSVFRNAGVPAVNTSGRFESGGYAQPSFAPSRGAQSDAPIVIYLDAVVDAEGIFIRGGMTESGRQVIVKQNDATNLKKRHR